MSDPRSGDNLEKQSPVPPAAPAPPGVSPFGAGPPPESASLPDPGPGIEGPEAMAW